MGLSKIAPLNNRDVLVIGIKIAKNISKNTDPKWSNTFPVFSKLKDETKTCLANAARLLKTPKDCKKSCSERLQKCFSHIFLRNQRLNLPISV